MKEQESDGILDTHKIDFQLEKTEKSFSKKYLEYRIAIISMIRDFGKIWMMG